MSLFIAGQKIAAISGPVQLSILTPTNKFVFDIDISPTLILLGDDHELSNLCDTSHENLQQVYDRNEGIILRLTDKSFYKALDKLATSEQPVDYYVESFFPFKLLQKDNYLQIDRKNFVDIVDAVITYLPQKYLACFSTKNTAKKQEVCFTNNIRYHLVDVRFAHTNFNYDSDTDILRNADMSYESEVITNLICSSLLVNHDNPIFHGSSELAIDVLEETCKDPMHFARWFYNFDNQTFLARSLILKQTKKFYKSRYTDVVNRDGSYNTKSIFSIKLQQFFLEYYEYFITTKFNVARMRELSAQIRKSIISHKNDMKELERKGTIHTSFGNMPMCGIVHIERFKAYSNIISEYVKLLAIPLLDIYFLFRCWKASGTRGWLSVLSAGYNHTDTIRKFLIYKGYFVERFFAETDVKIADGVITKSRCLDLTRTKNKEDLHLETLNKDPVVHFKDPPARPPVLFSLEETRDLLST